MNQIDFRPGGVLTLVLSLEFSFRALYKFKLTALFQAITSISSVALHSMISFCVLQVARAIRSKKITSPTSASMRTRWQYTRNKEGGGVLVSSNLFFSDSVKCFSNSICKRC